MNILKVKVFCFSNSKDLEKAINKWLNKTEPPIVVNLIVQSESTDTITISIFYINR